MADTGAAARPHHRGPRRSTTRYGLPAVSASGRLYDELDLIVDLAAQAPSPRNLQPWRFRARDGGVELLVDPTRVTDEPEARRQAVIACGAALYNMRLAAGHLGIEPRVTLLPDPGAPDVLARLEAAAERPPSGHEDQLLAAVARRRTRRSPFERGFVPQPLVDRLASAVAAEGALLVSAPEGPRRAALDDVMGRATAMSNHDAARTQGLRASWPHGTHRGQLEVLGTRGDEPHDWLVAGQALQRLLLTATVDWVQARFFTLALEEPKLRERVRREVCSGRHPQVVLELGHQTPLGLPEHPAVPIDRGSTP